MKHINSDGQLVHVNQNQLDGIKAGIAEIMQGCMTLNKVLTMIQIPESSKYPEGRLELHDSHVKAFNPHQTARGQK